MTQIELHHKRQSILQNKAKLLGQLEDVKKQLLITLPHTDYLRVMALKSSIVTKIQTLDAELSVLKVSKHEACVKDNEDHIASKTPWIRQLIELRDKYQVFAADGTRSPTMRRMASEFTLDLTPIIRSMLGSKATLDV